MKSILEACRTLFDKSPQPFGVARVYIDESGKPYDFSYEYLNPAMAAMTNQTVEELQGKAVYAMWGGDTTWLDYFYEAAYHDVSIEFESVSALIEQFLDVVAFPIAEGFCGFLIQDVTSWMGRAHLTMENASAGIFFYDMRTQNLMLTSAARERCGLDTGYLSIDEFAKRTFGEKHGAELSEQVKSFRDSDGRVLFEGERIDGRWLRFSLAHAGTTDQFAYGFLEDFTRTKDAEIRSNRRLKIIESISHENFALYLVNLDANLIEPYRVRDKVSWSLFDIGKSGMDYSNFLRMYVQQFVNSADQEMVSRTLDPDALKKRLDSGVQDFSINYRRKFEENEQFVELRIFQMPDQGHEIVLAARNINDEILEQLRQKEALQDALDLAENANNAKSTFLTNMSHDFRTPLNSITGFASIALEHLEDTDRVKDYLQKIIMSSDHLTNLVNEILDVSRVESGKLALSEDPVDLLELGANVKTMFTEQAAQRNLTFSVEIKNIIHTHVIGDGMRIGQILVNTIGNALKFTPAGGHVSLQVTERPLAPEGYGDYLFTVTDTGCGMSPEFMDKLFLPFERDDSNIMGSHTEGTGLGMTITKNLVDLMGGTIDVKSELNKGTEFYIQIPLRLAQDSPTSPSQKLESSSQKNRRKFENRRALVVDDDDLSREVAVEMLREYGITCEEAGNGREAVEMIQSSAPFYYDIVIMDMRMPVLSGDEATVAIRSLDRDDVATLPIVALTADAFEEGYRRAHETGMTAHLTKPISINTLQQVLEEYLG